MSELHSTNITPPPITVYHRFKPGDCIRPVGGARTKFTVEGVELSERGPLYRFVNYHRNLNDTVGYYDAAYELVARTKKVRVYTITVEADEDNDGTSRMVDSDMRGAVADGITRVSPHFFRLYNVTNCTSIVEEREV